MVDFVSIPQQSPNRIPPPPPRVTPVDSETFRQWFDSIFQKQNAFFSNNVLSTSKNQFNVYSEFTHGVTMYGVFFDPITEGPYATQLVLRGGVNATSQAGKSGLGLAIRDYWYRGINFVNGVFANGVMAFSSIDRGQTKIILGNPMPATYDIGVIVSVDNFLYKIPLVPYP